MKKPMLKPTLPEDDYSLVIRTDFTDEEAWIRICEAIHKPQTKDKFQASVEYINDKNYDGLLSKELMSILPKKSERTFAFMVDAKSISSKDQSVLVVDLFDEPGLTFRVVFSEVWSVENNLRLANMDFSDFADEVDKEGVFRGFR